MHHNRFLTEDLHFKKTGVNSILTCKGFCSLHDTMIFREIEVGDINYSSYRSHLLLSFRGIVNEVRKKQVLNDWWQSSLKSGNLTYQQKSFLKWQIFLQELGIRDMLFYSDNILSELMQESGEPNFVFNHFELPYHEVLSSAIFSPHLNEELLGDDKVEDMVTEEWINTVLHTIFCHIFPFNNKLHFIIGCHKNYLEEEPNFLTDMHELNENEKLKYVSDILIKRIETWACSNSFYELNIKPKEEKVLGLCELFPVSLSPKEEIDLNLFDNY